MDTQQSHTTATSAHPKRPGRTKRREEPFFVDLHSEVPLLVTQASQEAQVRRAIAAWSTYLARLEQERNDQDIDVLMAQAYLHRGARYAALEAWQAAVSDLTQVIKLLASGSEHRTAMLYRAYAYDGLLANQEAISDLTEVLSCYERAEPHLILPEDGHMAQFYAYRALLRCRQSTFEQAIADCDLAIALDGNCAAAYSVRGNASSHLGKLEQGLADCDRSLDTSDEAVLFYRRALIHQQLGNYQEAWADLGVARDREPSNSQFCRAQRELMEQWLARLGMHAPPSPQGIIIGRPERTRRWGVRKRVFRIQRSLFFDCLRREGGKSPFRATTTLRRRCACGMPRSEGLTWTNS